MTSHRLHVPVSRFTAAAVVALAFGAASASAATMRRLGTPAQIPTGAHALGALNAGRSIQATVTLAPRDPAALRSFAQEVSTPGSPDFHQYLTPAQFVARFGPTAGEVDQARAALAAPGLSLGTLSANHVIRRLRAGGSGRARLLGLVHPLSPR
jgi:subtilase family serine protease